MGSTFKDAETAAEFQSAACDAILNTARELGPDVDPAALAEAARDGKVIANALAGAADRERPPKYRYYTALLAALRAGKGGE